MTIAMNNRQKAVMFLLHEDPDRDLYEGAGTFAYKGVPQKMFFVTYTANAKYQPLTKREVDKLVASRHIREKWPGCYCLAQTVDESRA